MCKCAYRNGPFRGFCTHQPSMKTSISQDKGATSAVVKVSTNVDQCLEMFLTIARRLNQTQMEQGIPVMSYAKLVHMSKMAEQQEKCTKSIVIS